MGSFSTTYEHPTIVGKESQRIAGNLPLFGIKNARALRWSSCQHHFFIRSGIDELSSLAFAGSLLDSYISLPFNTIKLACALLFRLIFAWQQDHLHGV